MDITALYEAVEASGRFKIVRVSFNRHFTHLCVTDLFALDSQAETHISFTESEWRDASINDIATRIEARCDGTPYPRIDHYR